MIRISIKKFLTSVSVPPTILCVLLIPHLHPAADELLDADDPEEEDVTPP